MNKKQNTDRFRDFILQHNKISFTDTEKKAALEGFMIGLGFFGFLYALATAPDFFIVTKLRYPAKQ